LRSYTGTAEGNTERSPALAAELVSIPVAVIATVGEDLTVLVAKAVTTTIPIVFTTGGDPVEIGISPPSSEGGS
jgi:putative ABC transport system substrate-binding protein